MELAQLREIADGVGKLAETVFLEAQFLECLPLTDRFRKRRQLVRADVQITQRRCTPQRCGQIGETRLRWIHELELRKIADPPRERGELSVTQIEHLDLRQLCYALG